MTRVHSRDVVIAVANGEEQVRLGGQLAVPEQALGVVVFAHGSGSSRFSPRNMRVAAALNQAGLATLLFDLLTVEEATDRAIVFDISFLARRLLVAVHWLRQQPSCEGLPLCFFGASTGAAAALVAAADLGSEVSSVVSRGGRADLARGRLGEIVAPTLLIVGGEDPIVADLNRDVLSLIPWGQLAVIPGASHLFEEPGTLGKVSELAIRWFKRHLGQAEENHLKIG